MCGLHVVLEKIQSDTHLSLGHAYSATDSTASETNFSEASKASTYFEEPVSVMGYTLERRLGQGAEGNVWFAQSDQKKGVAIKICKKNPQHRKQYKLFKMLGACPNVVCAHDFIETEEICAVVMDHIQGQNLHEKIKEWSLQRVRHEEHHQTAYNIFEGILSGLKHMHQAEVCHRDIKPSNIMITVNGTAVIVDMGILSQCPGNLSSLEKVSTIINELPWGTLAYMSPEAVRGKVQDQRSDVWSVGVVLYEMLSIKSPLFSGRDIIKKILDDPVDTTAFSTAMDAFISKALKKAPEDRFQDAGEMMDVFTHVKGCSEGKVPDALIPAIRWKPEPAYPKPRNASGDEKIVVYVFYCRMRTHVNLDGEADILAELQNEHLQFSQRQKATKMYFSSVLAKLDHTTGFQFSGHAEKGQLIWHTEDSVASNKPPIADPLYSKQLVSRIQHSTAKTLLEFFFFNTCDSLAMAVDIHEWSKSAKNAGVRYVIAWSGPVDDNVSVKFTREFYIFLRSNPRSYGRAFVQACNSLNKTDVGNPCLLWHDCFTGAVLDAEFTTDVYTTTGAKMWNKSSAALSDPLPVTVSDSDTSDDEYAEQSPTVPSTLATSYESNTQDIRRGWGEPQDESDFSARAGGAEKKALEALGFRIMFKGQEPAEGNGIENRMLTGEAVKEMFGVKKYAHLWGQKGKAVKAAKQLLKCSPVTAAEESIDESIIWLLDAEKLRQHNIDEHAKQNNCTKPIPCRCKKCKSAKRHVRQLQNVISCRTLLESILTKHMNKVCKESEEGVTSSASSEEEDSTVIPCAGKSKCTREGQSKGERNTGSKDGDDTQAAAQSCAINKIYGRN